jgi:hypothetical protein
MHSQHLTLKGEMYEILDGWDKKTKSRYLFSICIENDDSSFQILLYFDL